VKDEQIEALLRRYRPIARLPLDDGRSIPEYPIQQLAPTWPWAVAAAALLAITVGLHGAVVPSPDTSSLVDPASVQAIADELGSSPGSRLMAEWIARREAVLERERMARASAPEPDRQ